MSKEEYNMSKEELNNYYNFCLIFSNLNELEKLKFLTNLDYKKIKNIYLDNYFFRNSVINFELFNLIIKSKNKLIINSMLIASKKYLKDICNVPFPEIQKDIIEVFINFINYDKYFNKQFYNLIKYLELNEIQNNIRRDIEKVYLYNKLEDKLPPKFKQKVNKI